MRTEMNIENLGRRILLLSDLLKVIDHMHDMDGANGLSAVIVAAQDHVDCIIGELDSLERDHTPVMSLFNEWMQLHEQTNLMEDRPPQDESDSQFLAPFDALEKRITNTHPITAADFAAKAIVTSSFGSHDMPWEWGEFWAEARKLVGMTEAA